MIKHFLFAFIALGSMIGATDISYAEQSNENVVTAYKHDSDIFKCHKDAT